MQLADKDDWLCLLLFLLSLSPLFNLRTPKIVRLLGRIINADCLIVSLIRLVAGLALIAVRIQDITSAFREKMCVF